MAALQQQCAKRHTLCCGPIEPLAGLNTAFLGRHNSLQSSVHFEVVGHLTEAYANTPEQIQIDACMTIAGTFIGPPHTFPFCGYPVVATLGRVIVLCCCVVSFKRVPHVAFNRTQLHCRRLTTANNLICKYLLRSLVLIDGLVQQWLSKVGIIALVVPKSSVANDVKDHIGAPFLPPFSRHLEGADNSHRVVRITMEDWDSERLSQIRAVLRRPGIRGVCGETDLVIHNDVNGPTHIKVVDLR
mmetsp:Transcript_115423/g.230154  ORF Transcript_115423/g.230154 Transcript_115423/m.230154 type:complete len:243 (-) Transcript_115423:172-900(-)